MLYKSFALGCEISAGLGKEKINYGQLFFKSKQNIFMASKVPVLTVAVSATGMLTRNYCQASKNTDAKCITGGWMMQMGAVWVMLCPWNNYCLWHEWPGFVGSVDTCQWPLSLWGSSFPGCQSGEVTLEAALPLELQLWDTQCAAVASQAWDTRKCWLCLRKYEYTYFLI